MSRRKFDFWLLAAGAVYVAVVGGWIVWSVARILEIIGKA